MSDVSLESVQPGLTSRRRIRAFDAIVLILLMLALWQAIGSWTQGVAVSPPLQTLTYLFDLVRTWMFWDHAVATLTAFALAFLLSALIGLALGLILGVARFAGEVAEPILAGFYTIPKVTLGHTHSGGISGSRLSVGGEVQQCFGDARVEDSTDRADEAAVEVGLFWTLLARRLERDAEGRDGRRVWKKNATDRGVKYGVQGNS
jgi:hypothetical protein